MTATCLTCDWPACKSNTTYGSLRVLQNHKTDVHVADVLKDWPGSCSWPGCKSKIFFKTSKRLESHVYNIHITPLCCTMRGCDHKRPFGRQADLERHVASRHTVTRNYKCPHPTCQHISTFARKDKLKHHEKTYHGQCPCKNNHCPYGFVSTEMAERHGSGWVWHYFYECGLGSCGHTSSSRFNRCGLKLHLIHDHLVSSEVIEQALKKMGYSYNGATLTYFPDGFSDYQDCKGCVEKLKKTASSKEGDDEE